MIKLLIILYSYYTSNNHINMDFKSFHAANLFDVKGKVSPCLFVPLSSWAASVLIDSLVSSPEEVPV
jgi:hypothetical protein